MKMFFSTRKYCCGARYLVLAWFLAQIHLKLICGKRCKLWPKGIVHYTLKGKLSEKVNQQVRVSIDIINTLTPVRMIKIESGESIPPGVGYISIEQKNQSNTGCGFIGPTKHILQVSETTKVYDRQNIKLPFEFCITIRFLEELGCEESTLITKFDNRVLQNSRSGFTEEWLDIIYKMYYAERWPWMDGRYNEEIKEILEESDDYDLMIEISRARKK